MPRHSQTEKSENVAMAHNITTEEITVIVQKAVEAATKVIRDEFQRLFDELATRVDDIERRMSEVEQTNIGGISTRIDDLDQDIKAARSEAREFMIAANDCEQYSRRNNIRIKGLSVSENDDCRQAVCDFVRTQLHVSGFEPGDIEYAHIVPVRADASSSSSSHAQASRSAGNASHQESGLQTVIAKFCRREKRDLVLRSRRRLKGTPISIAEDLTALNVKTLNRVRNDTRVQSAWTWNGKIVVLLRGNGQKLMIKPFQSVPG